MHEHNNTYTNLFYFSTSRTSFVPRNHLAVLDIVDIVPLTGYSCFRTAFPGKSNVESIVARLPACSVILRVFSNDGQYIENILQSCLYLCVFHITVQREVFVHFISILFEFASLFIFAIWMSLPYIQEKVFKIDTLRSGETPVNNSFMVVLASGTLALNDITLTHQPVVRDTGFAHRLPLPRGCAQIECLKVLRLV